MEQKSTSWLTIIIVAAFSVCGGFVGGSMLGVRERGSLKAKNAALAKSETLTSRSLATSRNEQDDLSSQLDQAYSDVEHWQSECERLQSVIDRRAEAVAGFHPPMVAEFGHFDAESRISELECEIASLKELVRGGNTGTVDGSSPGQPPPQVVQDMPRDPLAAKLQCSAFTKKGPRCSRPARSGGKCWQHGG
jgi:hypothetical protein